MFTVYGMSDSGNCYKVKLALEQLALPYRWVEVDPARGETRTPRVPGDEPERQGADARAGGRQLPAGVERDPLLPRRTARACCRPTACERARVLQWMFFEQYSHEPYVAVARFILRYLPPDSPRRAELPRLLERGNQALAVMEQHLRARAVLRRRAVQRRRHRAVRLHALRGRRRLRPCPPIPRSGAWLERVQVAAAPRAPAIAYTG